MTLAFAMFLSACTTQDGLSGVATVTPSALKSAASEADRESTIWDVLNTNLSTTPVKVNRYIWQASLDVLDFMPIESIDPFSGIIVMGWLVLLQVAKAYRATVHVSEPALDARSFACALATRSGPATAETMRALEGRNTFTRATTSPR